MEQTEGGRQSIRVSSVAALATGETMTDLTFVNAP